MKVAGVCLKKSQIKPKREWIVNTVYFGKKIPLSSFKKIIKLNFPYLSESHSSKGILNNNNDFRDEQR